jgi:DNA polymerase-3 subunit alpha
VQAGAFDAMGRSRQRTFASIEAALRSSALTREDRRKGQRMLFQPAAPAAAPATTTNGAARVDDEWPEHERLQREKEALGFYLSGHPFEKRGTFLRRIAGHSTATLYGLPPKTSVRIAGMVSSVRVMQIKSGRSAGQKMARFQLEDLDGRVGVTCFARTYQQVKDRLVDDSIVFVTGRLDDKSEEQALLLEQLEPADEVVRREVAGLVLALAGADAGDGMLDRLVAACERHRGTQHLHLDVEEGGVIHRLRLDVGIHVTDDLLDELALLVGPENMSFTRR